MRAKVSSYVLCLILSTSTVCLFLLHHWRLSTPPPTQRNASLCSDSLDGLLPINLRASGIVAPRSSLVLAPQLCSYSRIMLGVTVFGSFDNLAALLDSLSCNSVVLSIVVVDDAGPHSIPSELLRRCPILRVIRKTEQRGLTHSWNVLWEWFKQMDRFDVLIIANDDVRVTGHTLRMLASALLTPAQSVNVLGERYRFFSMGVMSSRNGAGKSWRISNLQRVASSPFFAAQANASLVDLYASDPGCFVAMSKFQETRALHGFEDKPVAVATEVPGFNGFFFGVNRDAEILEFMDGILFDPATVNVDNEDRLHRRAQAKGLHSGLCLSCFVFHIKSATISSLADREDIHGVWRPNLSVSPVPETHMIRELPLLRNPVKASREVLQNVFVLIDASLTQHAYISVVVRHYTRCLSIPPENVVVSILMAKQASAEGEAVLLSHMKSVCADWRVRQHVFSGPVKLRLISMQHEFSILQREHWLLLTKASKLVHFGDLPLERLVLSLNVAGIDAVEDAHGLVFMQRATTFISPNSDTVGARESCRQLLMARERECSFLHLAPPIVANLTPDYITGEHSSVTCPCPHSLVTC